MLLSGPFDPGYDDVVVQELGTALDIRRSGGRVLLIRGLGRREFGLGDDFALGCLLFGDGLPLGGFALLVGLLVGLGEPPLLPLGLGLPALLLLLPPEFREAVVLPPGFQIRLVARRLPSFGPPAGSSASLGPPDGDLGVAALDDAVGLSHLGPLGSEGRPALRPDPLGLRDLGHFPAFSLCHVIASRDCRDSSRRGVHAATGSWSWVWTVGWKGVGWMSSSCCWSSWVWSWTCWSCCGVRESWPGETSTRAL